VALNLALFSPLGAQALADVFAPAPVAVIRASAPAWEPAPAKPQPADEAATGARAPADGEPAPAAAKTAATAPRPTTVAPITTVAATARPAAAAAPAYVELTVVMNTTFANTGPDAVRRGEVTVPLMAVPQSANQVVLAETITPTPTHVSTDELGNRAGNFDLAGIAPGEALVVRQEYRLRIWGNGGAGLVGPVLAAHLKPQAKIESAAPEIAAIAAALTGGQDLAVETKIARAFAKTRELLRYDSNSATRNTGALTALGGGSGVCEDYACLFVAICRAMGVPARVVTGWGRDYNTARGAWGADGRELRGFRHAWAEAFVPGKGWITFDPTHDRAGISGVAKGSLGPGTLICDNYGDRSITGKYVGGRLQVTRNQRVSW
jgi:transglutaminase-like putative cysteine protease